MNTFDKIVSALTLRTAQAAQFVLALVMLIIVLNVISRKIWQPVPGTVELVEMSGAVLLALAVAYTAITKSHIMVGILVERFPPRIQAAVGIVVNTIALFFSFLLARETFFFAGKMMQGGYTTGQLFIPIAPSIYLVAFGFAMLTLVLLRDVIEDLITVAKGSETK